jgi:hypothetical protein
MNNVAKELSLSKTTVLPEGKHAKVSLIEVTAQYRVTINDSFVFKTLFLLCRNFLKALNSCCQLVQTLQTW